MIPGDPAAGWRPRRVRVWAADPAPVAPLEWHAHLSVEGLPEYEPYRAVPGGSALQATALVFKHLDRLALDQDAMLVDTLSDPSP